MIQGTYGRTYFDLPKPGGPLSSWENRLAERLAMVGSTESALIWTEKATPAGRLISRLAPSTPLNNGSDSTGSHWPTVRARPFEETPESFHKRNDAIAARRPKGASGMPLGVMLLSLWPAPVVADVEGGRRARGGKRSDELLLNGLMRSGSNAQTEPKGAPNPEFACWLMGWPDELISGALRAIQSFLVLRPKSLPHSRKPSEMREAA